MLGEFDLERLGQPAHREFRRRINREARDAIETRCRSGVEDRRSRRRAEQWQRHIDAVDDPAEIDRDQPVRRSEEHTSELQSLMRISYAVFCLKKKITTRT